MSAWAALLVFGVACACAVAAGRVRDERRRDLLLLAAGGIGVKLAVLVDLAHAHIVMQALEVFVFGTALYLLFRVSRRRA